MKREYTKAELGLISGMVIGAVLALTMFSLTGAAWWLTVTGAGIALGYGVGASWDRRAG